MSDNEYSEQSWNKYAQALDYGSTIYYHAGADQALVDYACARIEEAKAGLSMRNYITISSNKSVYQDHALSRLIDGDTSSLTWLQNNQAQGDYIRFQLPGTVSSFADRHLFCQCWFRYLASWQSGDLRRWQ